MLHTKPDSRRIQQAVGLSPLFLIIHKDRLQHGAPTVGRLIVRRRIEVKPLASTRQCDIEYAECFRELTI